MLYVRVILKYFDKNSVIKLTDVFNFIKSKILNATLTFGMNNRIEKKQTSS